MALDYQKLKHWPFKPEVRQYGRGDVIRFARGFGAGLPGPLRTDDERFTGNDASSALPMVAVALADGEFWQQDPEAGLQWQQIVHAEEAITMHRALPTSGTLHIERRVVEIYDRGADKGAMLLEQELLRDPAGELLVTIDVTTVLRGDGGFGGTAEGAPKPRAMPADRPPDASIELMTPSREHPVFKLSDDFDVTSLVKNAKSGQLMLRGLCSFGLSGRAMLKLACNNEPRRLRRFGVRYAGPMLTDETMRIEWWRTGAGSGAFRMLAVERNVPVLNHCFIEFEPQ